MAASEGAAPAAPDPLTDADLVELARKRYTAGFAAAVESALAQGGHFGDFVRRSLSRELELEAGDGGL